jgi:hypothetical protein
MLNASPPRYFSSETVSRIAAGPSPTTGGFSAV